MTKIILQAGQLIDVINYNENQYFSLVVSEDLPMPTAIYKEDTSIGVNVQRFIVDSTIIANINTSESLTDNNGNFYERVESAAILTENNFNPLIESDEAKN
jgi:hypothetical protein